MANRVIEFQILSKDPDSTGRFYSNLFGWSVDAANPMGYRRVAAGEGIPGGIWPAPPQSPNFVQLFVAVDDVATAVSRAESLGARVLIPPTTLPDGDVLAILHDPQGMSFGVCQRSM